MTPLVLNNPKTAEAFEALTDVDQWVEVPPEKNADCGCHNYAGMISNITPCAAERYVKYKGNLLQKKAVDTPAPGAAQTSGDSEKQKAGK